MHVEIWGERTVSTPDIYLEYYVPDFTECEQGHNTLAFRIFLNFKDLQETLDK